MDVTSHIPYSLKQIPHHVPCCQLVVSFDFEPLTNENFYNWMKSSLAVRLLSTASTLEYPAKDKHGWWLGGRLPANRHFKRRRVSSWTHLLTTSFTLALVNLVRGLDYAYHVFGCKSTLNLQLFWLYISREDIIRNKTTKDWLVMRWSKQSPKATTTCSDLSVPFSIYGAFFSVNLFYVQSGTKTIAQPGHY